MRDESPVFGRVRIENAVRAAADRGIRTGVVRPPMIWGHGHAPPIAAPLHLPEFYRDLLIWPRRSTADPEHACAEVSLRGAVTNDPKTTNRARWPVA